MGKIEKSMEALISKVAVRCALAHSEEVLPLPTAVPAFALICVLHHSDFGHRKSQNSVHLNVLTVKNTKIPAPGVGYFPSCFWSGWVHRLPQNGAAYCRSAWV